MSNKSLVKTDSVENKTQIYNMKKHLNIVFIGHVDAGKSTIAGQILVKTGQIQNRIVKQYENEAKQNNRTSWYLAYIMDTSKEERAKGKTIECGRARFETKTKRFTILDAPGHKIYVPNMIVGASQADVGVLVISARKGEFETGFCKGGQTREHALLAKTLGILRIVVVINKMDDKTVLWSEKRYNNIKTQLLPYLKKCGFKEKYIVFLPISGFTGENIKDNLDKTNGKYKWVKSLSLINTLDELKEIKRMPNDPVKIPLTGAYKEGKYIILFGKIESGTLKLDSTYKLMPNNKQITIKKIVIDDNEVDYAIHGENVFVTVTNLLLENVNHGHVLCENIDSCISAQKFDAEVMLLKLLPHKNLFTNGYTCMIHIHSLVVQCQVEKLQAKIKNGKRTKNPIIYCKSNDRCYVTLSIKKIGYFETYQQSRQLGKFILRDEGLTIGIGKILKIYE